MSNTTIRLRHRVRLCWFHANDCNGAKVVTACGLRREHNDVHPGDAADYIVPDEPEPERTLCLRCYPDGPTYIVNVKTPAQLRALSGLLA